PFVSRDLAPHRALGGTRSPRGSPWAARRAAAAYLPSGGLSALWDVRMRDLGARVVSRGTSAEGRPLTAYLLGPSGLGLPNAQVPGASPASPPSVLLTGLLHGVELIGSLALLQAVEALCVAGVQRSVNLVVAPVLNPDALARN